MEIEATSATAGQNDQTALIAEMIRKSSDHANSLMQVKLNAGFETEKMQMREQLSSMMFQTERSISNEQSTRTLSSMFGSFSLVQKIMQNMG